jgi:hypothetical protein
MAAANSSSIGAKQDAETPTGELSRLAHYGFLRDVLVTIWNALQLLMFHQSVKILLVARKLNY